MDTNKHLSVYLNDHLAGSVAALELLDALDRSADAPDLRQVVATLRTGITEDRYALETLMGRAGVAISGPRRATAWIGEKITELKLRVDDPLEGTLRTFELLELVAVGIEGKRALWAALTAVSDVVPALRDVDYQHLTQRADQQRATVESQRVKWARAALATAFGDKAVEPTRSRSAH